MRKVIVVSAGLAALLLGANEASAIEVTKHINAPGEPAKVWAIVSDFCSIKDWHPLIADCKETKEGGATIRTLTLKGGGTIKEKLDESDDSSYSYEILESPLPVKNYKAKLSVEEDERSPDRTTVTWDATFDPNGASDDDARKKISDIFFAGLKGIKQKALPPEGTAGGD